MSRVSPLEALLPGGSSRSALVLGGGCPPELLPGAARAEVGAVDVAVIAPTSGEARRHGFVEEAVAQAAGALAGGGLIFVLLPRRRRRRARSVLAAAGFVVDGYALLPRAVAPRHLVSRDRNVWRYALTRLFTERPRVRAALAGAARVPGMEHALSPLATGVVLVARRPATAAPAAWATAAAALAAPTGVVVSGSWRGRGGAITLHLFTAGATAPACVAKVADGASAEAAALALHRTAAESAGAVVPRVLAQTEVAGVPAIVQAALEGPSAAAALLRTPTRGADVVRAVGDWVLRWNLATAERRPLERALLEERLLEPAHALAALVNDGGAYEAWLRVRCDAVLGAEVPLVAAHNDLTMWNVVLAPDGRIGVLDWETAEPAALPLGDLVYAAVDAVAATRGYRSRLAAARECLEPGGAYAGVVRDLEHAAREALVLDDGAAELALHACWLRHALNERERGEADEFGEIVRWLAGRVVP